MTACRADSYNDRNSSVLLVGSERFRHACRHQPSHLSLVPFLPSSQMHDGRQEKLYMMICYYPYCYLYRFNNWRPGIQSLGPCSITQQVVLLLI